jgi:hypothetical protein
MKRRDGITVANSRGCLKPETQVLPATGYGIRRQRIWVSLLQPRGTHVAERHRRAGGVLLLQGHARRLANRLTTGPSASAISAINLLSIALPNVLKVSATITNEFCPPATFSR